MFHGDKAYAGEAAVVSFSRSSLMTYFRAKRWYFFARQGRAKERNSCAISAEHERSMAIKDQAWRSERGYETASKIECIE
jgi:hypothetical protein